MAMSATTYKDTDDLVDTVWPWLRDDSFVIRELPKTEMFKRAVEWANDTAPNPLRDRLERK